MFVTKIILINETIVRNIAKIYYLYAKKSPKSQKRKKKEHFFRFLFFVSKNVISLQTLKL
jgi:hypothetical protein